VIIRKFNIDVLGGGLEDLKDLKPFLKVVEVAAVHPEFPSLQAGYQLMVKGGGLEHLSRHLADSRAFFYADTGSGTPLIFTLVNNRVVG
jgi:hypothetical protein